uniref:cadherin-like domain-containing protein n=1 Tax=Thaumasiovibrio occultus TaxID=1891184 RepID=UPI000D365B98
AGFEGDVTVTVKDQSYNDMAGNAGSSGTDSVTVDTLAADAPTVRILNDRTPDDGTLVNSEIYDDGTVVIHVGVSRSDLDNGGKVNLVISKGATTSEVELSLNGADQLVDSAGKVYDYNNGIITLIETVPADGEIVRVTATQTDKGGNQSEAGEDSAVVGDTTAAEAPIVHITNDGEPGDGTLTNIEIDDSGNVSIEVTINGQDLADGGSVMLDIVNGGIKDPVTLTLTGDVLSDDRFTYDSQTQTIHFTQSAPADGQTISVSATQTDKAGNKSEQGQDSAVVGDTTAASAPTVHIVNDGRPGDGSLTTSEIYNDGTVVINVGVSRSDLNNGGSVNLVISNGATTTEVELSLNGAGQLVDSAGQVYDFNNGIITLTENAPAHGETITVTATQTDRDGNVSQEGKDTAVVDTVYGEGNEESPTFAPEVKIVDDNNLDDGVINKDELGNDNVQVSVMVDSKTLAVDGASVTLSINGQSVEFKLVNGLLVNLDGSPQSKFTYSKGVITWNETVAEGETITVTATQTDSDGNVSQQGADSAHINVSPVAGSVILPAVNEDNAITFTADQLLVNSSDPDGANQNLSDLSISEVSYTGNQGVLVDNGDGTFTFTPTHDYSGTVNIDFIVSDAQGNTASSSASVTVNPVADAPVVEVSLVSIGKGASEAVIYQQIAEAVKNGQTVSQEWLEQIGVVSQKHLSGDNESNLITGTDGIDAIYGDQNVVPWYDAPLGNDVIIASGGNDAIFGDNSTDYVSGTPDSFDGYDTVVYGGSFEDYILKSMGLDHSGVAHWKITDLRGIDTPNDPNTPEKENGNHLYEIDRLVFKDAIVEITNDGTGTYCILQDTVYTVDISAQLTDVDGSESFAELRLSGLAPGATLLTSTGETLGVANANGELVLSNLDAYLKPGSSTEIELSGVQILVPTKTEVDKDGNSTTYVVDKDGNPSNVTLPLDLNVQVDSVETVTKDDPLPSEATGQDSVLLTNVVSHEASIDQNEAREVLTGQHDIAVGDLQGELIQPGADLNIAFMVDTSGSLEDQINVLKNEMVSIVTEINRSATSGSGTVNVFIADFDTRTKTTVAVEVGSGAALDELKTSINSMTSGGSTNFDDVFNSTANWFNDQTNGKNMVYFITDGKASSHNVEQTSSPFSVATGNGDVSLVDYAKTVLVPEQGELLIANVTRSDQWNSKVYEITVADDGKLSYRQEGNSDWKPVTSGNEEDGFSLYIRPDGNGGNQLIGHNKNSGNTPIDKQEALDAFENLLSKDVVVEAIGIGNEVDDAYLSGFDSASTVETQVPVDQLKELIIDKLLLVAPNTDIIESGKGDDILFGDSILLPNTPNQGYQALEDFIAGKLVASNEIAVGEVPTEVQVHNYIRENVEVFDISNAAHQYDILDGGEGGDIIYGQGGNDSIFGRNGNDILLGGDGSDSLHGGNGDDILIGGAGADAMWGAAGSDVFKFNADSLTTSAAAPVEVDTIIDFSIADGDKLDFSDIFSVNESDPLENYLSVSDNGQSGVIVTVSTSPDQSLQVELDGVSSAELTNYLFDPNNSGIEK